MYVLSFYFDLFLSSGIYDEYFYGFRGIWMNFVDLKGFLWSEVYYRDVFRGAILGDGQMHAETNLA